MSRRSDSQDLELQRLLGQARKATEEADRRLRAPLENEEDEVTGVEAPESYRAPMGSASFSLNAGPVRLRGEKVPAWQLMLLLALLACLAAGVALATGWKP